MQKQTCKKHKVKFDEWCPKCEEEQLLKELNKKDIEANLPFCVHKEVFKRIIKKHLGEEKDARYD